MCLRVFEVSDKVKVRQELVEAKVQLRGVAERPWLGKEGRGGWAGLARSVQELSSGEEMERGECCCRFPYFFLILRHRSMYGVSRSVRSSRKWSNNTDKPRRRELLRSMRSKEGGGCSKFLLASGLVLVVPPRHTQRRFPLPTYFARPQRNTQKQIRGAETQTHLHWGQPSSPVVSSADCSHESAPIARRGAPPDTCGHVFIDAKKRKTRTHTPRAHTADAGGSHDLVMRFDRKTTPSTRWETQFCSFTEKDFLASTTRRPRHTGKRISRRGASAMSRDFGLSSGGPSPRTPSSANTAR